MKKRERKIERNKKYNKSRMKERKRDRQIKEIATPGKLYERKKKACKIGNHN